MVERLHDSVAIQHRAVHEDHQGIGGHETPVELAVARRAQRIPAIALEGEAIIQSQMGHARTVAGPQRAGKT